MTVEDKPLAHSHSRIQMFEQCPKKYYHLVIAKDCKDQGNEASIYGNRVHKSFEDRLNDGLVLPPDLAKHEDKCVAIEQLGGKLEAEKELVLTKDFVQTGWWDSDAWLRTKIDVLVKKDKTALVFDWKTGKRKPEFAQMRLYAMNVFVEDPAIEKVKANFVWLRDEQMDPHVYHRSELGGLIDALKTKTDRIEEAKTLGVWQAKPGPLCDWCPAKDICVYAQKGRRR